MELRELQALVRRLEALHEMKQMEENRLAAGVTGEIVRASLQHHIDYLQSQIDDSQGQIQKQIQTHPSLLEPAQRLQTIPGIALATAAILLAELGDFTPFRGARKVAAFADLVPRIRESGSSLRGQTRLSKIGSSRLRKALYFPAIRALRCNPSIQALAGRLATAGKCKMLIIGAAIRKLLHIAYEVLKSRWPFVTNFNPQTSITS